MDESGNSGGNLLDDAQPLFVLAAVHVDEKVAEQLIRETSWDGTGPELKFSRLRSTRPGRRQILEILDLGVLTPETARVSVCHKPYMITAKMIDVLVEPAFHRRGLDFYADDGALKWPQGLHELAPQQLGPELWTRLREVFVSLIRRAGSRPVSEFVSLLDQALELPADARVELPLQAMRDEAEAQFAASETVPDQLDPALPFLMEQIFAWGERLDSFEIEHDQTPIIERNQRAIRNLADPGMEPATFHVGEAAVRYPLKVTALREVDSRTSRRVQVADVLAGAASFQQNAYVGASRDPAFVDALEHTPLRGLMDHFLAPREFVRRSMALGEDGE